MHAYIFIHNHIPIWIQNIHIHTHARGNILRTQSRIQPHNYTNIPIIKHKNISISSQVDITTVNKRTTFTLK